MYFDKSASCFYLYVIFIALFFLLGLIVGDIRVITLLNLIMAGAAAAAVATGATGAAASPA